MRWWPAGRAATCWAAAGRADRRGSPGDGATGHDPGPRPAWRPARPPARPCVPAVAAPVQRTPGRRPVPVAVDSHRLRQCQPSGHQPSRRRPCGHRPRFWEQQRTARASAVSGSTATPTPAAVSGWARTAADPQPPLRRHGRTAHVSFVRLRWSSGQVDAASGAAVRMRGHRTRPAEHREPARPGIADTRDRRRAWGHCNSGHAGQPAAGPSTTPQRCPTGTGPQCAAPASTPG